MLQKKSNTYASISMLVFPSSKIDLSLLEILDHICNTGNHSVRRYLTTLSGTEGSVEISSHMLKNIAVSSVITQALIFSHSASNWVVTKWPRIARSTCHVHRNTRLCGYTVSSAAICAWSRSVIMTLGRMSGLASLTHVRKNLMIAVVPLDVSIQATGTPCGSSAPHTPERPISLLTSSPTIPGNDRE
jgi:hypothetical protein